MRLLICALGIMVFCGGCASIEPRYNSYHKIPDAMPKITFVRNQNSAGSSVITTITINDWIVGTLAPGEHVTLEYPAGHHQVRVKGKQIPLTFRPNREYYFLVDQGSDGSVDSVRRIYAKEAAIFMENTNYHTSR